MVYLWFADSFMASDTLKFIYTYLVFRNFILQGAIQGLVNDFILQWSHQLYLSEAAFSKHSFPS
jgi:hypothetical protein